MNERESNFGVCIPDTPREKFVIGVYAAVDEATASELNRLQIDSGIISSCKLGCAHCCRHHILTNVAEAHTLKQYIQRELSADQINDLRMRTQQWHEWENSRLGRYPASDSKEKPDLSRYEHCCPLMVNGACSAYPVRPIVCRTHLVSSHPRFCLATNDPEPTGGAPVVLTSVLTAIRPFSKAMRDHVEKGGVDFSRSIMLLPDWLSIEMGWTDGR
jgi:Fe-S-cluster containining protein